MARHRYIISYDIANPRRLHQVIEIMEGTGTRLQFSVFLCDLSIRELLLWQDTILDVIDASEDSVIRIDLGSMSNKDIVVIGVPRTLPREGPQVV